MISRLFTYLIKNQFATALLVLFLAWILYQIREILIGIFISYILMAALYPYVSFLRRRGLHNAIAVAITYVIAVSLFVLLIVPLIPFIVSQIQTLFLHFPEYIDQAARILGLRVNQESLNSILFAEAGSLGTNAVALTGTVFSGIFSVLTIIVVGFYFLLEHDKLKKGMTELFPKNSREKVATTITQVDEKLGGWLRGQVVLSIFIGLITWAALSILGIEFALPLALLAGILEIVPTLGPIVASIPAIIVALTISPNLALLVAAIYVVIQILENNVLVPRIMQKAVGLNPLIILLGIIIGGKLLGVAGALLSIPFISLIVVVYRNLNSEKA